MVILENGDIEYQDKKPAAETEEEDEAVNIQSVESQENLECPNKAAGA